MAHPLHSDATAAQESKTFHILASAFPWLVSRRTPRLGALACPDLRAETGDTTSQAPLPGSPFVWNPLAPLLS